MFLTGVVNVMEPNDFLISVNPNPISSSATISFDGVEAGIINSSELFIFQNDGKLFNNFPINDFQLEINCSLYPRGNYFFVFFNNEKIISVKSVIIE
jgi:hypothetical protein